VNVIEKCSRFKKLLIGKMCSVVLCTIQMLTISNVVGYSDRAKEIEEISLTVRLMACVLWRTFSGGRDV
jgi:hypothetical protein